MTTIGCSRCLLDEDVPGVQIRDDGLCSVCNEYDRVWGNWAETEKDRHAELEKILENARKKNRAYDVLVPISGGKDSIYILYLCRKLYNLRCLAVTWDNGFLSELARENIRNACEILEVDHIYYGMSRPLLMRLYRYFFLNTGFFCPVCMKGIQVAETRAQVAFNIPLSIRGSSRRTEEHISWEFFLDGNPSFIENVLEGCPLEKEAKNLVSTVGLFKSPPMIQMPDYLDWKYDELYDTIINKLKWDAKGEWVEHGDCIVSNIVDYIRQSKFPKLVPEMLRFSKLVTCGQMTKKEAEMKVSENLGKAGVPGNLDAFLQDLNITKQEMDEVLADPTRHMKYLKQRSRVLRRLRALKNKTISFS
jgi:hypothetical protein